MSKICRCEQEDAELLPTKNVVVIVEDTHSSEMWKPYLEHSEKAGVRAVWSVPIYYREKIYGTFAIYHTKPYSPTELDIKLTILMSKYAVTAFTYLRQKEIENMYQLISDNAKDLITLTSFTGAFQYVNPSVTSILGFSPKEVLGTSFDDYIYDSDLIRLKAYHKQILHGNDSDSIEYIG